MHLFPFDLRNRHSALLEQMIEIRDPTLCRPEGTFCRIDDAIEPSGGARVDDIGTRRTMRHLQLRLHNHTFLHHLTLTLPKDTHNELTAKSVYRLRRM